MKINKQFLTLVLITLAAFLVRFIYSSTYPPLLWDEASLGYNAFSILKTGRDEYGSLLPLIFKSFGDYKPGLYVYLSMPFIALLGLNQLAVRLPSILLGSLTPLLLYKLIIAINPKKKKLAIISAFLLAITPFHIHFSRAAWETNIFTFQLVLASLAFTNYVNTKKIKYLLLSSTIFGLSLYTYQSAKMMSLLIIIFLFAHNIKTIFKNPKKIITAFILPLAVFAIPIATRLLTTTDSNRLEVLSIFSYPRSEAEKQQLISYSSPLNYQLYNNQAIFFIRSTLSRYLNHLSPNFLFFKGDWQNPRHSAIYTGVLLLPSILFLPLGLISLKTSRKLDLFFLIWLLIAPIPPSLTRDSLSAVRSASLVIPLTYFTAKGIIYFSKVFNKFLPTIKYLIITAYLLSFIYYGDLYLNHTVKTNQSDYLYGYKHAVEYINQNKQKYDKVYLTDFYGQPYIYYLFFSHYPPNKFQQQANLETDSTDVGKINNIDNIYFHSIPYNQNQTQDLIIYSKDEIWRQQLDKLPNFNELFDPIGVTNKQAQFYAYPKN